ncbi:hypothetical protein CEUSTIGMA_g6003.t1 [Chlamydomonas eustigma]|uniref:Uncharacterized protein n=1 Tax=Chlamydomonas eustigma TaxID=1157962 RepID=A0A250X660_9CHLO|nr:hypothetical protein CEUSTIGMA_g6003.t1 [Chlamydomonas eustigma]|eukprot:GAX78563.1 hypothetical protein CEUSTIGMA_g6003.t1 [Chlamydomonas eustigma]
MVFSWWGYVKCRRRIEGLFILNGVSSSVGVLLLLAFTAFICYSVNNQGLSNRADVEPLEQLQRYLTDDALKSTIQSQHPINRLQCGSWPDTYAILHRDILAGRAAQRYAIIRSRNEWENGLADRIASSVTIFFYALLTNRAFQYDWEGPTSLWATLNSDYIDWRYTGWDAGNSTMTMDYVAEHNNESEYNSFFVQQDLTFIGGEAHTVIWHADHAAVYHAFNNPHLKLRLTELGLKQDTAFACLFDFLYRPTDQVVQALRPYLPALLDPLAVKIGIQIRVGDWQLVNSSRYIIHPQNHPWLFQHFFDCAADIEEEAFFLAAVASNQAATAKTDAKPAAAAPPPLRAVWYLLTDMLEVRLAFKRKYPNRVLVDDQAEIQHTVKDKAATNQSFVQAVGELWAFSLTDYHIITKKSGFGKVGAMVSAKTRKHIFTIYYPMQVFNIMGSGGPAFDNRKVVTMWQRPRQCGREFADSLDFVCSDFTGI